MTSPGIATQDSFCGKEKTYKKTMSFQSLDRINRAAGSKPAGIGEQWGDAKLIKLYKNYQNACKKPPDCP
jgi:hypothetical protein